MEKIAITFIKNFILKYLGTAGLEKILILLLKALVNRTGSKIDDNIFNELFDKVSDEAKKDIKC